MRIAIFTEAYLPHISGIVTNLEDLTEQLELLGHNVLIVTSDPKARDFHMQGNVLHCPAKPAKNQFGFCIANPSSSGFSARLEKFRPDVLHIHTASPIGIAATRFAAKYDLPMVFTIHDYFENQLHYLASSRLMEPAARISGRGRFKECADNADIITSASKKAGTYLKACKIKRNLTVVPNSIDSHRFDYARVPLTKISQLKRTLNLGPDKTVALFAGNLVLEKGVDKLLEQWASQIKARDNVQLLIIGDGPEAQPLATWAKELGIARQVSFLGAVPHSKMLEYYAIGDLYVTASQNDLMSMSVLEAICCGLPALVPADPLNPDQIKEGVNGFAYKTAREFGNYVKKFASLDTDGKRILKKVVRRSILDAHVDDQAKKMTEIYEQAVKIHFLEPQESRNGR